MLVAGAGNPYTVSADAGPSIPAEQAIRRNANLAAIFAAVAVLFLPLAAAVAVFLGHTALSAMKRTGVGQQHRGAALVGVVLGWIWLPFLLLQLLVTVGDVRALFR